MATCTHCGREMRTATSCAGTPWILQGQEYAPIPYGEEEYAPIPYEEELARGRQHHQRCPDCGVALGGFHHPACDMEECPRCHGQLLSCGCADTARPLITPAA